MTSRIVERSPEKRHYRGEIATHREAYGDQLERLCGSLAVWNVQYCEGRAKIYRPLPQDPEEREKFEGIRPSTRIEVIKGKEMRKNVGLTDALIKLNANGNPNQDLRKRIPSLVNSLDVVATTVEMHKNREGAFFLSLLFDNITAIEAGEERADTWAALEDITGIPDLSRREFDPDIRLGYFPPGTLSNHRAFKLRDLLQKSVMPLSITLEPAHLPDWSKVRPAED